MKHVSIDLSQRRPPIQMDARGLRNLEVNLEQDLAHYGGQLPRRSVIAWHAFLSAMIEWGILVFAEYRRLVVHLPEFPSDPVERVLMGRALSYRHGRDEITSAELEVLSTRIRTAASKADGVLPDSLAVAWHAYIAALQVYGALTLNEYRMLLALLPRIADGDPIEPIVLGRG
jgi:hypothetical protein